jgi:hypothetical protein
MVQERASAVLSVSLEARTLEAGSPRPLAHAVCVIQEYLAQKNPLPPPKDYDRALGTCLQYGLRGGVFL